MFFCVADFTDPDSAAVPQRHRNDFYAKQAPHPDWLIWIGYYSGHNLTTSFYSSGLRVLPESEETKNRRHMAGDAHVGVAVIGKLLVHAVSTGRNDMLMFINTHYAPYVTLTQIWPSPDTVIDERPKTFPDRGFVELTKIPIMLFREFLERFGHRWV